MKTFISSFIGLIVLSCQGLYAIQPEPVVPDSLLTDKEKQGKTLFLRECRSCHRWDRDFAAPSWMSFMPAYRKDTTGIIEYTKAPGAHATDAFEPMEPIKLEEDEYRRIAEYLLRLFYYQNPPDKN